MLDAISVVNEPEEITELVNPHTGQTVVYDPRNKGWREKYAEEIEQLLALSSQIMDENGYHRNQGTRYPLIQKVCFSRFDIRTFCSADHESYKHEHALWKFELQVVELIQSFLRFTGECPVCRKLWKSG